MLAVILAAGYSLDGLWRVVERAIVWTTVRRFLEANGLGLGVLLVVLLFGWKLAKYARQRALGRSERAGGRHGR